MSPQSVDTLSAFVQQVLADVRAAGAYTQLVVQAEKMQREQEQREQQQPLLQRVSAWSDQDLFARPILRADDARCVRAGLLLLLDELDAAHEIVQAIPSSSGSFWHAIMHRREGDFANSKYWYARCRGHPVFDVEDLLDDEPHDRSDGTSLQRVDSILGPDLVDLVEEAVDLPAAHPRHALAVRLQQREWTLLFDHCAASATAGTHG